MITALNNVNILKFKGNQNTDIIIKIIFHLFKFYQILFCFYNDGTVGTLTA